MIGWIIAGVVVVLIGLWLVSVYNGLITLRNLVQEAWRQIDVELKRRHDLIGNLVETVKGYAAHERGTLEDVMKARAAAMAGGQSPAQQAQSEGLLSAALGRLIAVAEAYPDLKANQNFLALQQEPDLDRGPHRFGSSLLQRQCPRAQHPGRVGPVERRRRDVQHPPRGVLRGGGRRARRGARRLRPARDHHPAAERVCRGHGSRCPGGAARSPVDPVAGPSPLGDSRPRPASRPPRASTRHPASTSRRRRPGAAGATPLRRPGQAHGNCLLGFGKESRRARHCLCGVPLACASHPPWMGHQGWPDRRLWPNERRTTCASAPPSRLSQSPRSASACQPHRRRRQTCRTGMSTDSGAPASPSLGTKDTASAAGMTALTVRQYKAVCDGSWKNFSTIYVWQQFHDLGYAYNASAGVHVSGEAASRGWLLVRTGTVRSSRSRPTRSACAPRASARSPTSRAGSGRSPAQEHRAWVC